MFETAQKMVAVGKGILAADWSVGTATKKFEEYGITCDENTRRKYREMLFSTPGLEEFISGVILHEETIKQKTDEGKPLPEILTDKGILVGIRVDTGQVDMPGFSGELITEGLDKMREKLEEYKKLGASFAKWRAAYAISDVTPSRMNIIANVILHSIYAKYCQEAGIVPIIEPDVIINGSHTIDKCAAVTKEILDKTFLTLWDFGVDRKAIVLKPNMILPGKENKIKAVPEEVAQKTLNVVRSVVPVDVPGIAFLSGGQSEEEASANLNAINKLDKVPWQMTFSYARAMQASVLKVWGGKDENEKDAQKVLLKRARLNALARQGKYDPKMEEEV